MLKWLFTATLLAGCGSPPETVQCGGDFTVSPAFSPRDMDELGRVGARWSEFSASSVELVRGESRGTCHFEVVKASSLSDGRLAQYDTWDGYIQTAFVGGGPYWENAMLHELGHSFGLQHVSDPSAIMYAETSADQHFTDADYTECKRVGACR